MKMKRGLLWILALLVALSMLFTSCDFFNDSDNSNDDEVVDVNKNEDKDKDKNEDKNDQNNGTQSNAGNETESDPHPLGVGPFSGTPYVVLNANNPNFTKEEITTKSYEFYSELDNLGRCGYAMACIGKDLMPTEPREGLSVKPSGWVNNKYDSSIVSGGYIYNRCHLIGFQLTGENDNEKNLITGTRYINIEGMLPFENMVADYVKETGNHVMYRITPIYIGNNLLASGVQLEGYSVEDNGAEISFNVYAYNVQPGIVINYATGENWLPNEEPSKPENDKATEGSTENNGGDNNADENDQDTYILNTKTKKIHKPTCSNVKNITAANRGEHQGALNDLIANGYTPCGTCKPVVESQE